MSDAARATGIYGRSAVRRRAVNWQTSPSGKRIFALMQAAETPLSADDVARRVHVAPAYARSILRMMKDAEVVGIAAWQRNVGGNATPLYLLGAQDTPPPTPYSAAEKCRRYRASIMRDLPEPVAKRVLSALHGNTKVSTVVADGKTIYRRGVGVDRRALSEPFPSTITRDALPQRVPLPPLFPRDI